MNQAEYQSNLESLGCQLLGKGLYSSVYSSPVNRDLAIKVGENDAWPSYIAWATQHGHMGKFAPMVYGLKFHNGFYVATMERLVCTIGNLRYPENHLHLPRCTQLTAYYRMHYSDCEAVDLHAYISALTASRFCGDLHDGNAMLRKDGSIVITDPVSGDFSSDKFRLSRGTIRT